MSKMDKKHCIGCYDDFYNGNNPYSVKECWMLKSAKLIKRVEVHVDQRPPWTQKPRLLPNCYKRQRYVYVAPDNSSCHPDVMKARTQ